MGNSSKNDSRYSKSAKAKNKVIRELQEYQRQIDLLDKEIQKKEIELSKHDALDFEYCKCGTKMVFKEDKKTKDVFLGCPNYTIKEKTKHSSSPYYGSDKVLIKQYLKELNSLKQAKDQIKPPTIYLDEEEKEALQHSSVIFDEYPNILEEKNISNYLFQSLAIPMSISTKEYFDELLRYSRFRIFTKLPQVYTIEDKTRTVYSLTLRLLNRGVVLGTSAKTEAKIKRHFGNLDSQSFLSSLNDYITYHSPYNQYDSTREKEFAEYYFPKVLGNSWATYVYAQMPINLLLQTNEKRSFIDQRVDFLVCIENRNIIIELDGEEHQQKSKSDAERDNILKRNGYIVKRFSNEDVDTQSDAILHELKDTISQFSISALSTYDKKYLVACKIVHQVSIAIVKMLEEGHIFSRSNLSLEIDSNLFSADEQKLLLLFAIEEISELIENYAKLYGIEINLDFFDESAEKYWIQIGDGDDNRNSVVIRDIVLPINYLCSIHPFALLMPEKDAITEEILEYFLQYVYGYAQFRPGQFAAIRRTLRKEESIVLLPTGSGKSVIYQLSSMLLPGITVVISPLRALIEDQVNNLADKGINNVASIFSVDKKSKDEMVKKARAIMNNHSAMMLYIAPERMQIPDFRKEVEALRETNNFCLIAIDEAHCVSEWGHDFRAAYLQIGRSCRKMLKKGEFIPSIIALTGTASDNVLRDVKRDLEISNTDAIITPTTFDRPELHYSIIPCDSGQKFACIKKLLDQEIPRKFGCSFDKFSKLDGNKTFSGIIFTAFARPSKNRNYDAWTLFNSLKEEIPELQIGTYFSSAPSSLKKIDNGDNDEIWNCVIKSYAREFKENKLQLLVATKAFGMGIDKPNIRYVIHNSLPSSIEQYYQEVGRAGRDGADSECVMLFSNRNNSWNETILNPNLDWEKFKSMKESKKDSENDGDDISPLMFFHTNNFEGTKVEEKILLTVWNYLGKMSNDFTQFIEGSEVTITAKDIYNNYRIKESNSKATTESEHGCDIYIAVPDKEKNNIAKAIIRLVTLGIIKDYEYDYSKSEYKVILGKIERNKVLEKYLIFVDGCSRGRADNEKKELEQVQGDDCQFISAVISRYVDLVYGTIEKGRRRAMYSMFLLAKKAVQIQNPKKQDEYIRSEIQNYLVKDDTVDLVKNSNMYAGIYEILNAYPLYPNEVIVDSIEQENARKTSGYAERMLAADPYHPGLLYLRAITSIKSRDFHNADVVNDIVAAYENSVRYSIPTDVSITFLVKTMNLTFNSSCDLFKLLWDKIDVKSINRIIQKALEMGKDDISEHFKDYLLLHVASQSLRKMIGGK